LSERERGAERHQGEIGSSYVRAPTATRHMAALVLTVDTKSRSCRLSTS
jgi:hypothetical protein